MIVRLLTGALLALVLAQSANATSSTWLEESRSASDALARSVKAGYVSRADEARYLAILSDARRVRDRVPPLRAQLLDHVLAEVAGPEAPPAPPRPQPSPPSPGERRCLRPTSPPRGRH